MSRPSRSSAPGAVLFDFDFTLADSARPNIECVNFALGGLGLPVARFGDAVRTMGLTLPGILVALAGEEHGARADEFIDLFVLRSQEVMVRDTRLYEETPGLVRALAGLGCRLGIISSKPRLQIEEILEREELLAPFDKIVGFEDVERYKPAPDGLLMALEGLAVKPDDAVYVGDSVADARAAQAASVPFIAVLSGAASREEFAGYPRLATLPGVTRSGVLGVLERRPDGNPRRA